MLKLKLNLVMEEVNKMQQSRCKVMILTHRIKIIIVRYLFKTVLSYTKVSKPYNIVQLNNLISIVLLNSIWGSNPTVLWWLKPKEEIVIPTVKTLVKFVMLVKTK